MEGLWRCPHEHRDDTAFRGRKVHRNDPAYFDRGRKLRAEQAADAELQHPFSPCLHEVGPRLQPQHEQPQRHLHEGRQKPDDRPSADRLRLLCASSSEQRPEKRRTAGLAAQLRLHALSRPAVGRPLVP